MIVRFLNCGQGDSIVVEWTINDELHIGLIDSNKIKGYNPSLEHLKTIKPDKIDFIILTHPHEDHFSGLYDILDFCENRKIQIGIFYHTCYQIPEYLRMCVKSNHAASLLAKTILKIFHMRDINLINHIYDAKIETKENYLSKSIFLDFLSPTDVENRKFNNRVPLFNDDENVDCIPEANWLCAFIRIKDIINNWELLLTSDLPSDVFTRVRTDNLISDRVILAQCPHHGAKKNLNKVFWKNLKFVNGTPIVISVGDNIYGHPSGDVLKYFDDLGFVIYRTDNINANFNKMTESELLMNMLSSKVLTKNDSQSFNIIGNLVNHI